jgi:large subunit ribosomal protein L4
VGSIRSPLWRHGGTVHGPQPRSYEYRFPRKKLLGALRSALAAKLADGKLTVVESFELGDHKTKSFRSALEALNADKTALVIAGGENRNLELGSRNLQGIELMRPTEVHPYHLLRFDRAIVARDAMERWQESLRKSASKRAASEPPAATTRRKRSRQSAEVA